MKSKLSLLKAIAPVLTLTSTLAQGAAKTNRGDCEGLRTRFEFFMSSNSTNILIINNLQTDGHTYWSGSYSTYGDGVVNENEVDVKVTTRYTGSDHQIKLGKLKGIKLGNLWHMEFTPVDPETGKEKTSEKQTLTCTERD